MPPDLPTLDRLWLWKHSSCAYTFKISRGAPGAVANLLLWTLKRRCKGTSCEETEAFGPPVSNMIANIVNANCVTKPLEDKPKEIQSRYQTSRNCQFLGVSKVNKELWFDLSKPVLALQDIQKNSLKANQALVVTLQRVIKVEGKN